MVEKGNTLYQFGIRTSDTFVFIIQCESGLIESPLSENNFLISLTWAKGDIDVGDPMLKMEKFCVRPRHRKQKINYVLLIFHLSRLSLYIHDGS